MFFSNKSYYLAFEIKDIFYIFVLLFSLTFANINIQADEPRDENNYKNLSPTNLILPIQNLLTNIKDSVTPIDEAGNKREFSNEERFHKSISSFSTFLARIVPNYFVFIDTHRQAFESIAAKSASSPVIDLELSVLIYISSQALMSTFINWFEPQYSSFVENQNLYTAKRNNLLINKSSWWNKILRYSTYYIINDTFLQLIRFTADAPVSATEGISRITSSILISQIWMLQEYFVDSPRFKLMNDPNLQINGKRALSYSKGQWLFFAIHAPGNILHLMHSAHNDTKGASVYDSWLISPGQSLWLYYGALGSIFWGLVKWVQFKKQTTHTDFSKFIQSELKIAFKKAKSVIDPTKVKNIPKKISKKIIPSKLFRKPTGINSSICNSLLGNGA